MPFETLPCLLPHTHLGLWRLAEGEDEAFFLKRLTLYRNEQQRLASIRHPQKRLEWLSSRLCLKALLPPIGAVESLNHPSGKPYLSTRTHFISYTHSHNLACAIASTEYEVSVDIEFLGRKRNKETRHLFLNKAEIAFLAEKGEPDALFLLLWSAKEALYKAIGEKGVSLRHHLSLDLNENCLGPNGMIPGYVQTPEIEKAFYVYYAIYPDFVLTYTADGLQPPTGCPHAAHRNADTSQPEATH